MLRNFITFRLYQGFMQTSRNHLIIQRKSESRYSGATAEFKDHQVADSSSSEGTS